MSADQPSVSDVLTSIEHFLQIPYWFSARQCVAMSLRIRMECGGLLHDPANILVFDQEYQLIGEMDPSRLIESVFANVDEQKLRALKWPALVEQSSQILDELQVADVMIKIGPTLRPTDPVELAVASFAMPNHSVLPVIESGQLLGVVRRIDLVRKFVV